MTYQPNIFREIIVDNFAGGGGASTGIELATGRPVEIAINHDPDAIAMHRANHPYTRHFCESVWDVDPREVCTGQPVALAWFSPDCKHFSKAKGGKPVEKNIRGLAWVVLRWAALAKPRVIILENVEEFRTWGPVRRGKPVKSKAGMTFERWENQLENLGYVVEWRDLVAADYGAPTIRKRFFCVARCDGRPIVWPEPTHAKNGAGGKAPWRSAAEIIDWSLPCPSIFASREEIWQQYGLRAIRPLANNTQKRVACGLDKFVLKSGNPFIVPIGYGERSGQAPRLHNVQQPLPTTVAAGKHYLVAPSMVQVNHHGEFRGQLLEEPLQTMTSKNGNGIAAPVLAPYHMHNHENAAGTDMRAPVNTVMTNGAQMLVTPALTKYHGSKGEYVRGQQADKPLLTIDCANRYGLISPYLEEYHGNTPGGLPLTEPMPTTLGKAHEGLAAPVLAEYYGNGQNGLPVTDPLHTVTARDREGLTVAYMSKYFSGGHQGSGNASTEPLNTVTTVDHNALALAHIVKMKGTNIGQAACAPLQTTTAGGLHFGTLKTYLVKAAPGTPLYYWPQVRQLLNTYCGYNMADDDVLILEFGGVPYFIADIGLRMLIPRELYMGNGFPGDYIIEYDDKGQPYPRSKQVARCGNAVPPQFAEALTRANLPELCGAKIGSMEQLKKEMEG